MRALLSHTHASQYRHKPEAETIERPSLWHIDATRSIKLASARRVWAVKRSQKHSQSVNNRIPKDTHTLTSMGELSRN